VSWLTLKFVEPSQGAPVTPLADIAFDQNEYRRSEVQKSY
jgi:hypothetical protein